MKVMGVSERLYLDGARVKIVSILDAVAASGDSCADVPSAQTLSLGSPGLCSN